MAPPPVAMKVLFRRHSLRVARLYLALQQDSHGDSPFFFDSTSRKGSGIGTRLTLPELPQDSVGSSPVDSFPASAGTAEFSAAFALRIRRGAFLFRVGRQRQFGSSELTDTNERARKTGRIGQSGNPHAFPIRFPATGVGQIHAEKHPKPGRMLVASCHNPAINAQNVPRPQAAAGTCLCPLHAPMLATPFVPRRAARGGCWASSGGILARIGEGVQKVGE